MEPDRQEHRIERVELRDFDRPDRVRSYPRGRTDVVTLQTGAVAGFVFEPGWRWSEHVKPIVGTELCELAHVHYHAAGGCGSGCETGAISRPGRGSLAAVPPGHDAWVSGDEQVVVIDWRG